MDRSTSDRRIQTEGSYGEPWRRCVRLRRCFLNDRISWTLVSLSTRMRGEIMYRRAGLVCHILWIQHRQWASSPLQTTKCPLRGVGASNTKNRYLGCGTDLWKVIAVEEPNKSRVMKRGCKPLLW